MLNRFFSLNGSGVDKSDDIRASHLAGPAKVAKRDLNHLDSFIRTSEWFRDKPLSDEQDGVRNIAHRHHNANNKDPSRSLETDRMLHKYVYPNVFSPFLFMTLR